jgi:hypothetical protein
MTTCDQCNDKATTLFNVCSQAPGSALFGTRMFAIDRTNSKKWDYVPICQ